MLRRGMTCRNLPAGGKSAEVIEANQIRLPKRRPRAIDPPTKSVRLHRVPSIQRISPALPGFRERIGRNSGNCFGVTIAIEQEQMRIGPDIAGVGGNENRDIADEFDISL